MPAGIPSYRHHKPSSRAVVTLNGRDFYLGPWNTAESRDEYDRLLAEWMANGRQLPEAVPLGELTVVELLAAYLEFARTYYVRDGQVTSEYVAVKYVLRLVKQLYGRTRVKDFGPLALKAIRQKMLDSDLCRNQINQRTNRIRRVFRWGVENELVPPLVLEGLRAVAPLKRWRTTARESVKVSPVPDEHVAAVLPFVSRQVAAMIQLQSLAGMRPGEVVLLRPRDVDRSSQVWVYRPERHKTEYRGHEREVFFGPQAQVVLLPWLLRDSDAYCFSPEEAEADRNSLRRDNRQTPMTPSQAKRRPKTKPKRAKRDRYDRDSYRRAIDYAIAKAGVPHWHPHQLRHNCATRLRRDFGLDVAQVVLGQKCAQITEVYAEVDRTKAVAAMERVG
jgi:integrase